MKNNKLLIFIIIISLFFSLNALAKTKKIRTVGRSPLMKAPTKAGITSADELKDLAQKNVADIKVGFDKTGIPDLYQPFMNKLIASDLEEKELQVGEKFQWMFFRVYKKVKVIEDCEWAGKQPLPVFAITVTKECKDYHFAIPKKCGNVALVDITPTPPTCDVKVTPEKVNINDLVKVDISGSKCAESVEIKVYHPEGTEVGTKTLTPASPVWETSFSDPGDYIFKAIATNGEGMSSDACQAKLYINYPPECDLTVTPVKGYVGKPFTLDASGSTDKDGEVVKAEFVIKNRKDEVVETKVITVTPLSYDKIFKKSDIYTISLKVTDDFGADSKPADNCMASIEVKKRFLFLTEVGGLLAKGTYSGYIFARVGGLYKAVPDTLDILLRFGGAITMTGEPFHSFYMADLGMTLHMQKFYLGGGLGISSKVWENPMKDPSVWDSDVDVFLNLGFDVFENFNTTGSIFGEVRMPIGSDLKFENQHMFLLGFRYQF